jgi:hypothetical protein
MTPFEHTETGDCHAVTFVHSAHDGADQFLNGVGRRPAIGIKSRRENLDQLCFVHSHPPKQWSALDRLENTVNPQNADIHEPRAFTAKSSKEFFDAIGTREQLFFSRLSNCQA